MTEEKTQISVNWPPGKYRLIFTSNKPEERNSLNLYAEETVTIERSNVNTVRVRLQEGATLKGKILNPDGSPAPDAFVRFDLPDTGEDGIYWAPADQNGEFVIRGIRPYSRLIETNRFDKEVTVGGPGSETEITLTLED